MWDLLEAGADAPKGLRKERLTACEGDLPPIVARVSPNLKAPKTKELHN